MFTGLQGCWGGIPLGTFNRVSHAVTQAVHICRVPESLEGKPVQARSPQPDAAVLGPTVMPGISVRCPEMLRDSVVYTVELILLTMAIRMGVLCFCEVCSFLPTFYSSQFGSPWMQLILSRECALSMCDVVCWDCPFLFLPVPAQFKDRLFWKPFSSEKNTFPPSPTHPSLSLSLLLQFHFMH